MTKGQQQQLQVQVPEAFQDLFTNRSRTLVYFGGRGAGKSYSIATALIVRCISKKTKVLCVREIVHSIKDSVYELLLLTLDRLNVRNLFEVTRDSIICKHNGSSFIFAGLYRNVEKIKSIPDINVCWVAEADTVSDESLDLLIPTIREQDSQIIIEFNPRYPDDAVYKRYIENTPTNCFVKKVSWRDNPFISQTLIDEKDSDFATRPDDAKHIWEGELKHYGANVWTPPFDEKVHVKEFNLKDIKDVKYFQALDPHTSFYSASIWCAAWRQNGRIYKWVFDEWPSYSTVNAYYSDIRNKLHYTGSVADLARIFLATETGFKVDARYIDTRYAKGFGSQQSNLINNTRGLVQDFADIKNGGLLYQLPSETNIDRANDTIKADLRYNLLQEKSALNEPCLYISSNCKNVIRALKLHRYEEGCEKESETYKDFSDVMTILIGGLSEYRWPVKRPQNYNSPGGGPGGWMGV